jgi:hypothetical protein
MSRYFLKSDSDVCLAGGRAQPQNEVDWDHDAQDRLADIKALAVVSRARMDIGFRAGIRPPNFKQPELTALEQFLMRNQKAAAQTWSPDQNATRQSQSPLGTALTIEGGAAPEWLMMALQRGGQLERLLPASSHATRCLASPFFSSVLGSINSGLEVAGSGQGLRRFLAKINPGWEAAGSGQGLRRFWSSLAATLSLRSQPLQGPSRRTGARKQWWDGPGGAWWELQSSPWWKPKADPWWKQGGHWWE